ncbi:hypothetical protein DIPPA_04983 [Diplonema papillatum]|nr:hypothetical protein DIPPA_04983 [Diplonema papillatum]
MAKLLPCIGFAPALGLGGLFMATSWVFVLFDWAWHVAWVASIFYIATIVTMFGVIFCGTHCNVPPGARRCIKCGHLPYIDLSFLEL